MPQTALAKALIENPDAATQLLGEFTLGSLEGVILEGPVLLDMKSQRLLVAVRAVTGRTTTYTFDVPIEHDAEPGAKVYRDVRNAG